MKKIFCIVFVAALLLSVSGCANSSDEESVPPPVRIGSSRVRVSLAHIYTFEEALAEADAVARVMVGDWLAEDTELLQTYYEAAVLECFKGDMPDTITLLQSGCSTGTIVGYPLFAGGNELLVFLKEAPWLADDHTSPYWSIGSYTTVLDVSYDHSGTRYYADRYGVLGKTVENATNYAGVWTIAGEVYSAAIAADPFVAEVRYSYGHIFSEEDFVPLLLNNF
ncbi:MAG: hypothetical protein LBM28_03000 [Oscillospiraceae bacterium]|jgi:hypothetical protein|nr:hypothetical protein [Oscillospiraceae bacterium]